jgi:UDP-glucose 4-epimerase
VTPRALVTGGGGFLGSHLVDRLLGDGWSVRVLDTREPDELDEPNGQPDRPRPDWVTGDVCDGALVARLAEGTDTVFHMASRVGVDSYLEDAVAVVEVAVLGTGSVLRAAAAAEANVVVLSSSEVFGRNPAVPWAEDDDRVLGSTTTERWSYATAKGATEHMALAWHRQGRASVSVVRPFNVYGPRQRPRFVIPATIRAALRGEPVLRYDDGRQTRCFTYVDDLVDGVVRVATAPAASGEVFNLGSTVETTVAEVIEQALAACGVEAPVEPFDTSSWGGHYQDIRRRVPSVEKAARLLGWSATTPLADGLRRTVAWARDDPSWLS